MRFVEDFADLMLEPIEFSGRLGEVMLKIAERKQIMVKLLLFGLLSLF